MSAAPGLLTHPFFLLSSILGLGSLLFAADRALPHSALVVCALSLAGLLARAASLRRGESKASLSREDFALLHAVDIKSLGPWVKQNIRGHEEVVDLVMGELQKGLSLASAERTLGAFFLVGPTGTGKTFLANLISQALFPGSELVALRMNQFKHPDDVITLLGPPPGQPGYEIGGALTRPVLENPRRIILLDEFEKCHPDIQHCLYNVLDTGQCRDKSSGRTVYFHACVFFATCNAGVPDLRRAWEGTTDLNKRLGRGREALAKAASFEKALLARFDGIYLMDALDPLESAEVACLQLAFHWKKFGIEVAYAEPELLLEALRRNREFQEYGVRQLSRLMQTLTDPAIEEARREGARRVRLGIAPGTGKIVVTREAGE